jgi:hypothetical protein
VPIAPTYRLIYASHIAPVCQDDLKAALTSIVTRSIPANRKARITGLLVAHKGWFVQALEGPRAAVETLFTAIAADPRHHHALRSAKARSTGGCSSNGACARAC